MYLKNAMQEEWSSGGWHLFSIGDCPKADFDFKSFLKSEGDKIGKNSLIGEFYFDLSKEPKASIVASTWFEILQCAEIPFDPKIRREKLKHAYKEQAPYIKAHEALVKAKPAKQTELI